MIEVSLFGVHVHTETHNLCEETSCPISGGKFELSHSQNLPVFTPPVFHTLPALYFALSYAKLNLLHSLVSLCIDLFYELLNI